MDFLSIKIPRSWQKHSDIESAYQIVTWALFDRVSACDNLRVSCVKCWKRDNISVQILCNFTALHESQQHQILFHFKSKPVLRKSCVKKTMSAVSSFHQYRKGKNVENKQRYVAKMKSKTYMEVRWWVGCYEACMYVHSIEK